MFSKQTYISRREELKQKVGSGVILFPGNAESPMNYLHNTFHFRQDSDFLYYFGLNRADLTAIIDVDANKDYIFGDDYSIASTIWMGDLPTIAEQALEVGVENGGNDQEMEALLKAALSSGRKVHFLPQSRGDNNIKYGSILGINPARFNDYVSVPLIKAVVSMRVIKSAEEIEEMNRACNIGYEMHTAAMRACEVGKTERYVAGVVEGKALELGHGVSFHCIITQRGHILHNHDHSGILTDGRMMLVDSGGTTTMDYASDFTRSFPVNGKFTSVQKDIYQVVESAFDLGIEMVQPGTRFKDVHLASAKRVAEGLVNLGFMKGNIDDAVANGAHAMFFPTGLGHQIGLDVHDMEGLGENYVGYDETVERSTQFGLASLRMAKELKPGHVVTVEPGCYFIPILANKWEKEGINKDFINFDKVREFMDFGGVRIEDCIQVTEDGQRILGDKRTPYKIEDIEAEMAKPL